MSGKQRLDSLVVATTASAQLDIPTASDGNYAGVAPVVLCQLLGKIGVTSFYSPDEQLYTSCKGA